MSTENIWNPKYMDQNKNETSRERWWSGYISASEEKGRMFEAHHDPCSLKQYPAQKNSQISAKFSKQCHCSRFFVVYNTFPFAAKEFYIYLDSFWWNLQKKFQICSTMPII